MTNSDTVKLDALKKLIEEGRTDEVSFTDQQYVFDMMRKERQDAAILDNKKRFELASRKGLFNR